MNIFGNIFGVTFGLILLGLLGLGSYIGVKYVVDPFGTLEPQVATFAAIMSTVILWNAMFLASGLKWVSRRTSDAQQHAEKFQTYSQFLRLYMEPLRQGARSIEARSDSQAATVQELEQRLILCASPKVLNA